MSLVLTRRVGESFTIGDDITITVVGSVGKQTRIAIDAPRELAIRRDDMIKQKAVIAPNEEVSEQNHNVSQL